ncbi:MAG: tetratricopeptide repeat protein [Candidatus Tectomicrobia bacterium]|nr:tetratricopeptide repeat protein [Candidatus Tectomicrobia bacterium]
MSIINQALKKAQRERRQPPDRESWVQSVPLGNAAPPRRRPVLWVVSAMLLALGSGAAMHAWLSGPAAHLPAALRPARPVAEAAPPSQAAPPPAVATDSSARALPPAPRARPTQAETAAVPPVPSVGLAAPRQPALSPAEYVFRGNDLYRRGQYRAAVDMYAAALALRPGDLKARNNLGIAYMQLAMDDRAAGAFEEVLRRDGTYGLAYYNLACVHARAGNAAEAADYLQRAVEIEPRARDWARTDGDFALVREAPQFRRHLEP